MRVDFVANDVDWIEVFVDGEKKWSSNSVAPFFLKELLILPIHSVQDWYFDFENDFLPFRVDFENPPDGLELVE